MDLPEITKRPKGKPRKYPTDADFQNAVINYITLCETKWLWLPNIAGFCVHEDIDRHTFYDQELHYPHTYKKVQDMFENAVLTTKNASDTMKIFYLKNKFKYADKVDTNVFEEGRLRITVDMSHLSDEELIQLKALQSKIEKT